MATITFNLEQHQIFPLQHNPDVTDMGEGIVNIELIARKTISNILTNNLLVQEKDIDVITTGCYEQQIVGYRGHNPNEVAINYNMQNGLQDRIFTSVNKNLPINQGTATWEIPVYFTYSDQPEIPPKIINVTQRFTLKKNQDNEIQLTIEKGIQNDLKVLFESII